LGFRQRFAVQLRVQDHRSRLDRLLWEHQAAAARRMLALVDERHQALALARLALADDEPGIEAALQRVPNSLATDGGLQFERLHWRRRKDQDAAAIDILRAPPAQLGRPVAWWTERQIVIRRLIERQDPATAYQLAANHGMTGGPPLTEAEFLAGWLALHFLKQPAAAFEHFQRLYATAATPMSRARGAYWSGRAAEARGKAELARQWYAKAAQYPTMFYGQLGAEAVGGPHPITLPEQPVPSQAEVVAFNGRELVQVVRMLHEIDPADGADRVGLFLRRQIRDAETTEDHVLLARLALEVHRPDLAIFSTKEAFQAEGLTLPELGYPSIALHHTAGVEPALLLSLIRQESTFNPTTVSSAGARGLMQLMPATARAVAAKLKVPFAEPQLTGDPDTNILLGSAYLAALLDSYNGSYILAIAAYNAGGTRVREWLTKFGDPRTGAIDPLDWIESIPIGETRNYVQRLLEALQVYRLRLGHGTTDRTLGQDLRR
jgi:soluble lytic murein transglycosylase